MTLRGVSNADARTSQIPQLMPLTCISMYSKVAFCLTPVLTDQYSRAGERVIRRLLPAMLLPSCMGSSSMRPCLRYVKPRVRFPLIVSLLALTSTTRSSASSRHSCHVLDQTQNPITTKYAQARHSKLRHDKDHQLMGTDLDQTALTTFLQLEGKNVHAATDANFEGRWPR